MADIQTFLFVAIVLVIAAAASGYLVAKKKPQYLKYIAWVVVAMSTASYLAHRFFG